MDQKGLNVFYVSRNLKHKELGDGNVFCARCQSRVTINKGAISFNPNRKKNKKIIIIVLGRAASLRMNNNEAYILASLPVVTLANLYK